MDQRRVSFRQAIIIAWMALVNLVYYWQSLEPISRYLRNLLQE